MKFNLSPEQLSRHQKLIFKGIILGLALVGTLLFVLGQEKTTVQSPVETETPLVDLSRAPEDKSFWLFKAEHQLETQAQMQANFKVEIETLKTKQAEQMALIEAQKQALEAQRVERLETPQTLNVLSTHGTNTEGDGEEPPQPTSAIFSETMTSTQSQKALPHIDYFIPAGTYVKAVLLNGLDISAGVSSQANPQPVLLRLIDWGNLPNHARINLKDCRLIAAAHGELSNERVNMRLEKLSCVQQDGQVIESEVTGFVNGLDGKNGVRGKVVLRDAEVLKRGFMGGLLSGLGKASLGSQKSTFGAFDPKGGLNLFKDAGSEGASDAFELMAKYNIQRAEQYQPVLQVSAGVEVDVVFHAGRAFGVQKEGTKTFSKNENTWETQRP